MMDLQHMSSGQKNEYKALMAIALQYKREFSAPKVVAKGKGEVAEKIIHIAKKNNIDIRRDPQLIAILSALEVDDYIPFEAYAAVSGILAYIYKKNASLR